MFTKTQKGSQLNMYSRVDQFLSASSQKVYEDGNSWRNLFRELLLFTIRISQNYYIFAFRSF